MLAEHGRGALKAVVRAGGIGTSFLRPLPDFLIIGAKRGGTTSFYFDILAHPSVVPLYPPPIPGVKPIATKGVHYFDSNYDRSAWWYRSYMPSNLARERVRRKGIPAVAGEASPFYLFHPDAAQRAHDVAPEARIIALLRDPAMRTYSHWKERRRENAEPLEFAEALEAEPGRLAGERDKLIADPSYRSYAWEQQSYLTQSMYADALRPWVELYGRDRIFVRASEQYYDDPDRVLADVFDFLGLPQIATSTGEVRNAAAGRPLDQSVRDHLKGRLWEANQDLGSLLGQNFPWT